jgi:phosphoenolpyruvate carboxykinase (GTP)
LYGIVGSPYARYGVQLTDSEYVVVNMHIMTRMGEAIYPYIVKDGYVKCLHTVGAPLGNGEKILYGKQSNYKIHLPFSRRKIDYFVW